QGWSGGGAAAATRADASAERPLWWTGSRPRHTVETHVRLNRLYRKKECDSMSETVADLQDKINEFWTWRGKSGAPGDLAIRNDEALKVWMGVLEPLLPPPPADVVDLGTGQGFVALVMAALGHRVRGYDLAQGQLDRAREFAAASN